MTLISARRVRRRTTLAALSMVLLLLISGCDSAFEQQGEEPAASDQRGGALDIPADVQGQDLPSDVEEAEVADHVDGDTIEVAFPPADRQIDVRLVGIDAPESVRPDYPVECYGPEASDRLAQLLPLGTPVYLQRDASDEDRFGRLLRHVWILDEATGDAYLVSELLVREGFVEARRYGSDDRYEDRLDAAERAARSEGAGMWGACDG